MAGVDMSPEYASMATVNHSEGLSLVWVYLTLLGARILPLPRPAPIMLCEGAGALSAFATAGAQIPGLRVS